VMKHLKRAYLFLLLLFLYLPIAVLIALSFNGGTVIDKYYMSEGSKKAKQVTQWKCYTDQNGNRYSYQSEITYYVDFAGNKYDTKDVAVGKSGSSSDGLETDDDTSAYVTLEDDSQVSVTLQE